MKRACVVLGLAAGLCGAPVFALELDPAVRAKAIASAAPASAPATNPARELPDIVGGVDIDGRSFSGACNSTKTDVCYDAKEGRIILQSTKNWMPAIAGFTPEHISLRKDRITFRYSFK